MPTLIRRADGAEFTLSSYSRKHRVPHDLAHAVTERELGMPDGIFGCIAAGAMFGSMQQTAGKKRYDAKTRSTRILKAANSIGISEVITSVLHEAVRRTGRRCTLWSAKAGASAGLIPVPTLKRSSTAPPKPCAN